MTRLRVTVMDARGRSLGVRGVSRWLAQVAPAAARGAVNVVLVSNARIRQLNRTFRRRDQVTDVLSFSSGSASRPQRPAGGAGPVFLGEIVIARDVARRQARTAGHDELTELRILALHGLLHLMGYDHDHGDSTMAKLERRLRRKGRLREGLIERAHRR